MRSNNSVVDTEKLSKKYRTSVDKIIQAWKKGYNDLEISSKLNIDLIKLQRIRTDIEQAHSKARYESTATNPTKLF